MGTSQACPGPSGWHPILFCLCINCTSQLCVIYKLAEGALSLAVYVIDKDVIGLRSQDRALRNSPCHLPPFGHRAIDHNSG